MIITRLLPATEKVRNLPGGFSVMTYRLSMARNESESCLLSLRSDDALNNITVDVSSNDGFKVELFRERTVEIDRDALENPPFGKEPENYVAVRVNQPDPLVPFGEGECIGDGETLNILIRFTTLMAEAGEYTFTITLSSDERKNITYTVTVKVWGFAYPEERTVETSVGLSYEALARLYGYIDKNKHVAPPSYPESAKGTVVPAEAVPYVDELYVQYYDYMLDNRICSYYLPYDVLDDRADKYMSDPRVTTFRVFDGYSDEDLIRVAEKFKDHPEWRRKAYFYPLDEPLKKEDFERLFSMVERIKRLCPGIRCLSPFFRDIPLLPDKDSLEVMLENLGHMVPKICCFNDDFIYRHPGLNRAALEPFQTRLERARDEKGIKYWQYVCWEPGKPYVNLYLNEPGLDHRLLFWMQHKVGANGFLYWRSNFWAYVDPFEDMATVPMLNRHVFGDGSLVYNGNHIGIDGPCGSIRLEAVRDGLEDCEMLNMADAVLGRDWVISKIETIVKSVTEYTDSVELFTAVRNEIGDALEQALNEMA